MNRRNEMMMGERLVLLDTNVATYIKNYLLGNTKNMPQDILATIKNIISIMKLPNVQFDYSPYIFENIVKEKINEPKIYETFCAIEKWYYVQQGLSENEALARANDMFQWHTKYDKELYLNMYNESYLNLLIIC